MAGHTCHAIGCETEVPPRLFMCKQHWFMLPKIHRMEILLTYQPGQERYKNPSEEYLVAAHEAIIWLYEHHIPVGFERDYEIEKKMLAHHKEKLP